MKTALDRLFQHTFSVAKRVRTDTRIGTHPVSVAFAGVRLAQQVFTDLRQSTVLLIGAGDTIELAARHLRSEEHTSELQSLMRISYAVFCLKKKNKKNKITPHQTNQKKSN